MAIIPQEPAWWVCEVCRHENAIKDGTCARCELGVQVDDVLRAPLVPPPCATPVLLAVLMGGVAFVIGCLVWLVYTDPQAAQAERGRALAIGVAAALPCLASLMWIVARWRGYRRACGAWRAWALNPRGPSRLGR